MDDTILQRIIANQQQLRVQAGGVLDQQSQPAGPVFPLPAGVQRTSLNPQQQEALYEAWVSEINSRPSSTYSVEDRQALRFAINRTLRELGH